MSEIDLKELFELMMELGRKIDSKTDAIEQRISAVNTQLALNTQSLEEHMYRCELLEARCEAIDGRVNFLEDMQHSVKRFITWGFAIVSFVSILSAIIFGLLEHLK